MSRHLTPTELAREAGLERRAVIDKCLELGVPIFNGRIDKALFFSSMREPPDIAKADYFTMLDSDGNLIASFGDQASALRELERILAAEPEARGHIVLIAYDSTGHPLDELTRQRVAASA